MTRAYKSQKMIKAFVILLFIWMICEVKGIQNKKNLVFFISDDLSILDKPLKSSFLDKIKSTSIVYKNAITSSPLCLPARSSLLFGRGAHSNGLNGANATISYIDLHPTHVSLPELLQNQGYQVGIYGKVFHQSEQIKLQNKIKNMYTVRSDTKKIYTTYSRIDLNEQSEFINITTSGKSRSLLNLTLDQQTVDEISGDEAIKFIQNLDTSKPFALFFGVFKPHCPWTFKHADNINEQAVDDIYKMSFNLNRSYPEAEMTGGKLVYKNFKDAGVLRNFTDAYFRSAMTSFNVHDNVYRQLESRGMLENTVVVFLADHGFHVGDNSRWLKNSNFQMSLRIPMTISLPNRISGNCTKWASSSDLYYTLTKILDLPLPPQQISSNDLLECKNRNNIASTMWEGRSLFFNGYQCKFPPSLNLTQVEIYRKSDIYNRFPINDGIIKSKCIKRYMSRVNSP